MKLASLCLPLSLLFTVSYADAASIALTKDDCMEILERYAADPESVPQHLLDACKDMLGAIAPAAGPQKQKTDPCADPATADSVGCWGPWAALAPAAAGFKPTDLTAIDELQTRPELAAEFDPALLLTTLPLGECAAGAACGFATKAPGLEAQPIDTGNSDIVPFALAATGANFQLNANGIVEDVEGLTSLEGLQPRGTSNSRFLADDGATASLIIANIRNAANGDINNATGIWRHGAVNNQDDSNTSAGVFAWGIASTQETLNSLNRLNAGNATANFSGVMAGDTRTSAEMVVNFGSQPTWSGTWQNAARGFSFDANGAVQGANLISTGFSDNVVAQGSYVQGILQGEAGNQSVAHAINVNLTDGGIVKDVGTIRQAQ